MYHVTDLFRSVPRFDLNHYAYQSVVKQTYVYLLACSLFKGTDVEVRASYECSMASDPASDQKQGERNTAIIKRIL